jgi:Leucine-rich repeat (LRR) protein
MGLAMLTEEIKPLTNLRELYLTRNEFSVIPSELFYLCNLKYSVTA